MTGVRAQTALVALAAALTLAVLAPVIGVGEPAFVRGAATDLTLVADAVYTVEPEAGHVHVSMGVLARNHTTETRTRRFWFDHAFLAVQAGVTNVRIAGPKGARVRAQRRDAQSTLLRIDFGSRLYSGGSAPFRLAFDLPGRGKAASPQVRVGTTLITIPVWAYASTGARGSTVSVRLPSGWDVAVESGSFAKQATGAGGGQVLESGPLANPATFFAYVSAQRPAVYVDRSVTLPVGDQQVGLVLRTWEDDPAWGTRAGDLLGRVLPVLRRDIGLAWPLTEPLVVAEAVNRDAGAYAGIFDPAQGRIEVAYWAGPEVMIHQAAHGWFNGSLLADRWANEGFATFYALRAGGELGIDVRPPQLAGEAATATVPLNTWTPAEPPGSPTDSYGYVASLDLARAIEARVGPAVLAAVWADAATHVGAYQPATGPGSRAGATVADPPESVAAVPDWRGLLDLLEGRSGEDLAGMWRESVVRPAEAPLLDARAVARTAYSRTLALAGDWRLPRSIRDALRAWDFPMAESLMANARTVIAQRNAVAGLAVRDGVTLTEAMRIDFEGSNLPAASAQAEAERAAILAIEAAAATRSGDDDVLSRIGMLGEHPEADLVAAKAAIAAGDLHASLAAADRANRAWSEAWQEGRRRALLVLAVLVTILVLTSAGIGALRRSRRAVLHVATAGAEREVRRAAVQPGRAPSAPTPSAPTPSAPTPTAQPPAAPAPAAPAPTAVQPGSAPAPAAPEPAPGNLVGGWEGDAPAVMPPARRPPPGSVRSSGRRGL